MKFTMKSDIEFDAKTPDDALLKLGLYFIAQMDLKPILSMHNNEDLSDPPVNIDVIGALQDSIDVLTNNNVDGVTFIAMKGVFAEPGMMQ